MSCKFPNKSCLSFSFSGSVPGYFVGSGPGFQGKVEVLTARDSLKSLENQHKYSSMNSHKTEDWSVGGQFPGFKIVNT